ncbi:MAG TPA: NTP transferase domain-containing protein [Pirellulaceae bacterium]|nr:NTP transferase domain-containing protein [Pirellulaceae bacterium]
MTDHEFHDFSQPLGLILAAGKGTRMNSDLPKVLCQAHGRPLIQYVIDALRAAGVSAHVAVVGYRAELVQEALAGQPGLRYALQTEQLGTGHAVMMCREYLAHQRGPVIVLAGDSPMVQPASLRQLLKIWQTVGAACVLGTLMHPDPTGLGRIVRDEQGHFLRIVEQRDADETQQAIREVNMSTYVFAPQPLLAALDHLTADNRQKEYYITDVPEIMLRQGGIVEAHPVLQPIEALSVNTPEQLQQVEKALQAQRAS